MINISPNKHIIPAITAVPLEKGYKIQMNNKNNKIRKDILGPTSKEQ